MARIRNQEDFIARANEIYDYKYDYSQVKYVKSSEKVIIICTEHGPFEKTPNKHLSGQGCPVCGKNRTKLGVDEFIRRAKSIHGNRYDYSKVVYKRIDIPVEIICPVHGAFMQRPHSHIVLGQGCPKCANLAGGAKRRGQKNVAHRDDVKQKKAETCMERYGRKTWAESEKGRSRLHDIIVNEKLDVMKATCQERYGTDFWTQSDEGRAMMRELMSSDEMQAKVAEGYKAAYGMHYMQTDEGRERAKTYIDDERRKKMCKTMIERYGVPYSFESEDLRRKMQNTMLERYGVAFSYQFPEFVRKAWETKRRNGTFNTSKPEETMYALLCDVFGEDDVFCQYRDDARYPFACDFYIKSLDLFMELNAHWSHGGHWFDKNNEEDLQKLAEWQSRAKEKGSRYYHAAIHVWTERDLLKKATAEQNNLNYLVFWNQDLSDVREYLFK